MGPEILASLVAVAATKEAVSALLTGVIETVAGEATRVGGEAAIKQAQGALRNWKTAKGLKRLCDRGKQIRKVKTVWQLERELDLVKFYYPSKIKSTTEAAREVNRLRDFSFDGNLVVRGTVGQGKSIFLRYLAARELALGERIPVFLELRRLAPGQPLLDVILEEMKNLGLSEASEELFGMFADTGRLALLFDGFDELLESEVTRVVTELESLAVRWNEIRMVVTSRFDTAIEHSPHFRVYDLAPLASGEFAKVVERIAHKPELAAEIVAGVKRGHESIARLLTTPLLVSLLVVHYRVGQGIPENRVAFYEPLFMLLLQRHDKAKAGYVRRRHSGLADSELLQFFNCLCFVTRKDGVSVLKRHGLISAAQRALSWLKFTVKPDDALHDIERITCLLLSDGDEYRFLHKSVQEFHAACFVRDQPESVAHQFYYGMQQHWSEWQQELLFLETIDTYRFNRHFAIPMLDKVVSTLQGGRPSDLGTALIGRLTARVALRPRPEFLNTTYPSDHVGWCLIRYFEGSSELLERVAATAVRLASSGGGDGAHAEQRELPLHDVLPALGADDRLVAQAAETLGRGIQESLETRRRAVHGIEERRGLLEL